MLSTAERRARISAASQRRRVIGAAEALAPAGAVAPIGQQLAPLALLPFQFGQVVPPPPHLQVRVLNRSIMAAPVVTVEVDRSVGRAQRRADEALRAEIDLENYRYLRRLRARTGVNIHSDLLTGDEFDARDRSVFQQWAMDNPRQYVRPLQSGSDWLYDEYYLH